MVYITRVGKCSVYIADGGKWYIFYKNTIYGDLVLKSSQKRQGSGENGLINDTHNKLFLSAIQLGLCNKVCSVLYERLYQPKSKINSLFNTPPPFLDI